MAQNGSLADEVIHSIPPDPDYASVQKNYIRLQSYMNFASERTDELNESLNYALMTSSGLDHLAKQAKDDTVAVPVKVLRGLHEKIMKQIGVMQVPFTRMYLRDETRRISQNPPDMGLDIMKTYKALSTKLSFVYELAGALEETLAFAYITAEGLINKATDLSDDDNVEIPISDVSGLYKTIQLEKSISESLGKLLRKEELVYEPRPVNTYKLLEDSIEIIQRKVRMEGHIIERAYKDKPKDIYFSGDAGEARRVILNLTQNALDAFKREGIQGGRIRLDIVEYDDKTISIVEENNGPWLKEDPFQNVTTDILKTEWREFRGTGLRTCMDIVENKFEGLIIAENTDFGVAFEMLLKREKDLKT